MGRVKILEAYIDDLGVDDVLKLIEKFIKQDKPHRLITANSLMVNRISKDSKLKEAFDKADLVVADSIGIVWASKFLGYSSLPRIPGIDLMDGICALSMSKGYKIYLLGSYKGIVEKAAKNLLKKFPSLNIVGTHHGYFLRSLEEKKIIQDIKKAHPDILFVGINVPEQEKWIKKHQDELNVPLCMGIGGSFDVISSRLKRAPLWIRRIGLEWIYRFILQPWRIVRICNLPVFAYKVIQQKIGRGFTGEK